MTMPCKRLSQATAGTRATLPDGSIRVRQQCGDIGIQRDSLGIIERHAANAFEDAHDLSAMRALRDMRGDDKGRPRLKVACGYSRQCFVGWMMLDHRLVLYQVSLYIKTRMTYHYLNPITPYGAVVVSVGDR
jgi:hypothetical protein